jgi:hypothetical protein
MNEIKIGALDVPTGVGRRMAVLFERYGIRYAYLPSVTGWEFIFSYRESEVEALSADPDAVGVPVRILPSLGV